MNALLALKLAMYAPQAASPLGVWFFLGSNVGPVELGMTAEPYRQEFIFTPLGWRGYETKWRPAGFVGIRVPFNYDLDGSIGAKLSEDPKPYIAVSFKFSTLRPN